MAFMGVKWGGGGGGMGGMSGVADVFAKAMFGDPEREMKLALGRSDLETDLYRRAQIESAQRANEALTAARQQETDARIAGGRALGQAWFNQQNPDAGTAPDVGSADAPVPVEDVPIPTPSVAPRAAAPLQEGPAPIEIPSQVEPDLRVSTFPMKQQVMTPENPFQTQAPPVPVQTGVEPDFNISTAAPPVPVAERPADPYFEALDTYTQGDRRLRTVPPDLVAPDTSQTQVPGRPIMETFRDRPPPPSLQEEQISTGPNEPAIVDVPGRETPGTTVFAPPVDPRMEQRPTPLTEGTAATPATATGDPLAAGAPAQKPQVMPGPQPGTVAVTDPATGQHTIITEDQAIAIATSLVTNGGNIGANLGAIQGALEITGQPGKTPDVRQTTLYTGSAPGKDTAAAQVSGDIPAEAADPTKLKEQIQVIDNIPYILGVGPDGKPTLTVAEGWTKPGGGPADITASDKDTYDRVSRRLTLFAEKLRSGQKLTPQEKTQHAQDFLQQYGSKTTWVNDVEETITPARPPDLITPDQIGPDGGLLAAPASPTDATTAPPAVSTAAPAETVPAAPAGTGTVPPAEVNPAPTASPTVRVDPNGTPYSTAHESKVGDATIKNYGGWLGDGETEKMKTTSHATPGGGTATRTEPVTPRVSGEGSESSERSAKMLFQSIRAAKILDDTAPGEVPGGLQMALTEIQNVLAQSPGGAILSQVTNRLTDPEARMYAAAIFTFINGQLRPDTGAAITSNEFNLYRNNFALKPGASWPEYEQARAFRNDAMRAIRNTLIGRVSPEQLKLLDTQFAQMDVDLDWQPGQGQGGGGDTGGTVKTWTPDGKGGYQ